MDFSALRYCSLPFPPYRYVPGRAPHPTAHPDGHSYQPRGSPVHRVAFRPPEQWRDCPEYVYGCDLYNHAYWWEAHEAWEGLWQVTDKSGTQGRFLQVLIQTAACHLKLFEGKLEGVQSLRASSAAHVRHVLDAVGDARFMGLAVRDWWTAVSAYYAAAPNPRAQPTDAPSPILRSAHDPARYPYILLGPDAPHAPPPRG